MMAELPVLVLAAFRKAIACGDDKVAECMFVALEAHAHDVHWQDALEEAQQMIVGGISHNCACPKRR